MAFVIKCLGPEHQIPGNCVVSVQYDMGIREDSCSMKTVIVPVLKPGKGATDPSSYRPIALTSQLGKKMERIITDRTTYFIESKNL